MRLHFPENQNYDCVQCGRSCSYYGTVPVESRVVESLTPHPLGLRVSQRYGSAFDKRPDGSYTLHMVSPNEPTCVFLEADRCIIHSELGAEAKPLTCRQYPFQFTQTPDGIFVGASFFCTAVRQNRGRALAAHSEDLLSLLPQAHVAQVPLPIPLDTEHQLSWVQYLELEGSFFQSLSQDGLMSATSKLLAEQLRVPADQLEFVLQVADFSAFKLVLNLSSEVDGAFTQSLPLRISGSEFQGTWNELQPNLHYEVQLEAWARMYVHRKLLALYRPLRHNLWSLVLIPRLCRRLAALWPGEERFWWGLEQSELYLGSRGSAIDALTVQLQGFLARIQLP